MPPAVCPSYLKRAPGTARQQLSARSLWQGTRANRNTRAQVSNPDMADLWVELSPTEPCGSLITQLTDPPLAKAILVS